MTTIIDYLNDDVTTITQKFSSIQKRYFDPYSISITTETNKQVFFSDYLNNFVTTLLGTNNEVLTGLLVNINKETDTYIEYSLSRGLALSDSVLIEFTDDILIRIPKDSDNKLNENQYGLIFVDYQFVKTYPYNVATIKFVREDKFSTLDGAPFTPISLIYYDGANYQISPSEENTLELPDNVEDFINSLTDEYVKQILQNSLKPLSYRKNINEVVNNVINIAKELYLNFLNLSSTVYSDLLDLNKKYSILEEYVTQQLKKSIPLQDVITGKIYHLKILNGRLILEEE